MHKTGTLFGLLVQHHHRPVINRLTPPKLGTTRGGGGVHTPNRGVFEFFVERQPQERWATGSVIVESTGALRGVVHKAGQAEAVRRLEFFSPRDARNRNKQHQSVREKLQVYYIRIHDALSLFPQC